MIRSVAMMLYYSLGLYNEAAAIEKSVLTALENGARTGDIASAGDKVLGTREMGDLIAAGVAKA